MFNDLSKTGLIFGIIWQEQDALRKATAKGIKYGASPDTLVFKTTKGEYEGIRYNQIVSVRTCGISAS